MALSNGDTINTSTVRAIAVAPAGNVTGIILQAGGLINQPMTIINTSAFTIAFHTTPSTSHIVDSNTAPAIPAHAVRTYVWDSGTGFWYPAYADQQTARYA